MADKMRDQFVREIERMKAAKKASRSQYLRADYGKAIRKMEKELAEYDLYRGVGNGKRTTHASGASR